MHVTRRTAMAMAAASALAPALPSRAALAQSWPERSVRLIVPFTAGGGIDSIGRIVGARLSEKWRQQVVVENRGGAGGNIAAEMVARSDPDGHTMFISAVGHAVNRYLYPSINYDPVADFAPVTLLCLYPNLMVVPTASPVHTVQEFIARARTTPATFGSPGHGSSPHMAGEMFKRMTGAPLTHVPYRGASQALSDLVAGRVDVVFSVMASGLPLVQSGQLRALAVTTTDRVSAAPEVPTIAESGVPGYDVSAWFAFFVPAKTPTAIIRRMHDDTIAVLAEPATKARLDQLGVVIVGSTPEALAAHLKSEMDKWGPVIREAGITIRD